MYRDKYHPKVKKDLKKIDRLVQKSIVKIHIPKILNNPQNVGYILKGDLADIYSYHFIKNRVDYRIAYIIDEPNSIIYIISIAKRENFYIVLQKRLD